MAAAVAHGIARPAVARSSVGFGASARLEDLPALLGIQLAVVLEVVGELHPSSRRCGVQWLALAATFHVGTPLLFVDIHPLVRIPHRRPPQSRFSVPFGGRSSGRNRATAAEAP